MSCFCGRRQITVREGIENVVSILATVFELSRKPGSEGRICTPPPLQSGERVIALILVSNDTSIKI